MAIFYGTRFSNAAGDSEGLPIKRLWHETRYNTGEWANHVYVQLSGKNTEFKLGQAVTIKTPTDTFTGQIWHIYNSNDPLVYNIYVHPATKKASDIQDATSGTAWIGSAVPTSASNPMNSEPLNQEETGTKSSEIKSAQKSKNYILFGGVIIAAIFVALLYKKFKK